MQPLCCPRPTPHQAIPALRLMTWCANSVCTNTNNRPGKRQNRTNKQTGDAEGPTPSPTSSQTTKTTINQQIKQRFVRKSCEPRFPSLIGTEQYTDRQGQIKREETDGRECKGCRCCLRDVLECCTSQLAARMI